MSEIDDKLVEIAMKADDEGVGDYENLFPYLREACHVGVESVKADAALQARHDALVEATRDYFGYHDLSAQAECKKVIELRRHIQDLLAAEPEGK